MFEGGNLFSLHKEFTEIEDMALGKSKKAISVGKVYHMDMLSWDIY